jgi:hypothetical protein
MYGHYDVVELLMDQLPVLAELRDVRGRTRMFLSLSLELGIVMYM